VEFQWQLTATSNKNSEATFQQSTKHIIYTLLEPPKPPWGPDDEQSDFEFPWTDVLEKACDWSREARSRTQVASMITRELHRQGLDGKLRYNESQAFSRLSFSGTDTFDLAEFLRHLENSTDALLVNCTDCAILVSTFANILGCDLYQSQMGYRFGTNPIRMIGFFTEVTRTFEYHEVAWVDPCNHTAKLFDCCLQVDGDSVPSGGEFDPLLPVDISLGDPESGDYHFRIAQRVGGEHCTAFPSTKTRRRIARGTIRLRRIHVELERRLKEEFDFSFWKDLPSTGQLFRRPIDKLSEGFSQELWKLHRIRALNGDNLDMSETIWRSRINKDTTLRVLAYKSRSVLDARAFLLNLLGDFHLPVIERRFEVQTNDERFVIGDLAFSGPQDRVLLFARSNLVVFLQNAGSIFTSVADFAHDLDLNILKILQADQTNEDQSPTEETELHERESQVIDSTSFRKEKNTMAINFKDTQWSSIRPLPAGSPGPADLRRDGVFRFQKHDLASGAVEGIYYDVTVFKNERFEGEIRHIGGGVYTLSLNHRVPDKPFTRHYEGQTISEVNRISLVGGKWKEVRIPTVEASKGENQEDLVDQQEEGVWVATKP
jgi:hypothetical protein